MREEIIKTITGICEPNIEAVENVLFNMAEEEFEPYEAAKSLRIDLRQIDSEETYDLLNRFFIGIFGWSFETLLDRVKEEEYYGFKEETA